MLKKWSPDQFEDAALPHQHEGPESSSSNAGFVIAIFVDVLHPLAHAETWSLERAFPVKKEFNEKNYFFKILMIKKAIWEIVLQRTITLKQG